MTGRRLPPAPGELGLWHVAYFYEDERYVADLLDFVRGGLSHGEPTLVALPTTNLRRVNACLSADEVDRVRMVDMSVVGRNPGRIIGSVLGAFVQRHPAAPVRIVTETIWPGRTEEEYLACAEHEALVNVALAGVPAHVLCPYDAAGLSPDVLSDAARTHPATMRGDERRDSESYTDPVSTAESFDQPLSAPPDDAEVVVINTITGPRTIRRFAYDIGRRAGLPSERLDHLTITVHELAVNTILHGGGAGLMSIWTANGHVIVQVDDGGHITDPLAGRRPPGPTEAGHGLSVVHRVADLVRVHRTGDGTTVRACFRLA